MWHEVGQNFKKARSRKSKRLSREMGKTPARMLYMISICNTLAMVTSGDMAGHLHQTSHQNETWQVWLLVCQSGHLGQPAITAS